MNDVPAFDLLSQPIQKALYRMRWTSLRPLQEMTTKLLCLSDSDVLISARTAAGKTEAAFLPILSLINPHPAGSVRAMYVSPLKALINDQFRRLEELCEYATIPVHRWHGDVSQKDKRDLLHHPSGVLLITPESLESLFVNRSQALRHLFHSLSFVVIDEVHALQGNERGTHLRSLLFRLERYSISCPRLIGLSATIGNPEQTQHWLRPDAPKQVEIVSDQDSQKVIRFGLFAFRKSTDQKPEDDEEMNDGQQEMADHLYQSFRSGKNLIFANARAGVEFYTDELNKRARAEGYPDQFLVHHGSLSKEIREHTEKLMQSPRPYSTVCSATLELGIDIGNVRSVGQIGCPWSVSSLIQRLGRSGRAEGQPQQMQLYVLEPLPIEEIEQKLFPDLIQAIALTELMLEKWIEPAPPADGDLSTLIHQILSSIAETGGLRADELFNRLVKEGTFRQIPLETFVDLLKQLGTEDLIEQTPEGDLILGLAGERLVRSHEFYAAFASTPEYRVVFQSQPLGRLPTVYIPQIGDHLLMAGRRWRVIEIDQPRKDIAVSPARGRKKPLFTGSGGIVHSRVREKMRQILSEDGRVSYVNDTAGELLSQARQHFRQMGLATNNLIPSSPTKTLWFPWAGSHVVSTLSAMLRRHKVRVECGHVSIGIASGVDELRTLLQDIRRQPPSPDLLARLMQNPIDRKYDHFLNDRLKEWLIMQEGVDLAGAIQAIDEAIS